MGLTMDASEIRRGTYFEMEGVLYVVIDYTRHKPGKGPTNIKVKLKNVKQGTTIDKTFDAYLKLDVPDLEQKDMQYLYKDGEKFVFMDMISYEQRPVSAADLGDAVGYLKENTVIYAQIHNGEFVGVTLPTTVDLIVTDTPPGIKGDTAAGGNKSAVLETGISVNVPLFINVGDAIRVDTRTGEYYERVK